GANYARKVFRQSPLAAPTTVAIRKIRRSRPREFIAALLMIVGIRTCATAIPPPPSRNSSIASAPLGSVGNQEHIWLRPNDRAKAFPENRVVLDASHNSTRPFFATLFTALSGKEETDATSNCRYIRIQVCSSLFGLCRIQLGIASKALPLQAPAISIYHHSCQTLDREAFGPNHG